MAEEVRHGPRVIIVHKSNREKLVVLLETNKNKKIMKIILKLMSLTVMIGFMVGVLFLRCTNDLWTGIWTGSFIVMAVGYIYRIFVIELGKRN